MKGIDINMPNKGHLIILNTFIYKKTSPQLIEQDFCCVLFHFMKNDCS